MMNVFVSFKTMQGPTKYSTSQKNGLVDYHHVLIL